MPTLVQRPAEAPAAPQAPAASQIIPNPLQNPATDVGTLKSQVSELNIQLTGLQAQWDGLHSQLDAMLRNNPARPGVQQTWADVGVQIAKVKGDIAYREARIALAEGRETGTTAPPPDFPRGRINPDVAFPAAMVMLMVLGLPVSIAWARRLLRGTRQPAALPTDYSMRLDNIERAIEAVAIEVERVSEGQRFVTKIMVARPEYAAAPASNASKVAAESVSPEPKALGAGPIEPISVPQRERVHQPLNTPR